MVQEKQSAAATVADESTEQQQEDAKPEDPKRFSSREAMQGIITLLEKSVKTKETRLLMGRLMRQTALVRKHINAADITYFINTYLPENSSSSSFLVDYVKEVGVWHCNTQCRQLGCQ